MKIGFTLQVLKYGVWMTIIVLSINHKKEFIKYDALI